MLKNTFHWSLIKKRKHILDSYDITLLHVDVRQLEMDTVNLLLCVPNDNYSIVMIEIHMLHWIQMQQDSLLSWVIKEIDRDA